MSSAEDHEALRAPALTPGARRILDVASELFYRCGIHAVGVDTIAAESGITKRTLYNRFGSKDRLVEAYLQARHHAWWELMERRVAASPGSGVLALWDSYTENVDFSERGCAFINAAGELPADHPAHRVVRAHKRAVRRHLEALVRADHPGIAGPEAAANLVFLLLEGAITHHGIGDDPDLLRRAREAAERLVRDERAVLR